LLPDRLPRFVCKGQVDLFKVTVLKFDLSLTDAGFVFDFSLNLWVLTLELSIHLNMKPAFTGKITAGFDNLHEQVGIVAKNVSGTIFESFAYLTQKVLKFMSKAFYVEAELKAGFDYNEHDQLCAFMGVRFFLRFFGLEFEFEIEWNANVDEFIDKFVQKIIDFFRENISLLCTWAKGALKSLSQKVGVFFKKMDKKKLVKGEITPTDIEELKGELDAIEVSQEEKTIYEGYPIEVKIEGAAPLLDGVPPGLDDSSICAFSGFSGNAINVNDIVVQKPTVFKTAFGSVCDSFKKKAQKWKEKRKKRAAKQLQKREKGFMEENRKLSETNNTVYEEEEEVILTPISKDQVGETKEKTKADIKDEKDLTTKKEYTPTAPLKAKSHFMYKPKLDKKLSDSESDESSSSDDEDDDEIKPKSESLQAHLVKDQKQEGKEKTKEAPQSVETPAQPKKRKEKAKTAYKGRRRRGNEKSCREKKEQRKGFH